MRLQARCNLERVTAEQPAFPIILAIDPSMNNLGWACHNLNLGCDRYDIDSDAWRFGLIHPKSNERAPQYRWRDAFVKLRERVGWRPTHLASEWPSYFASAKGKIAAMKGYTLDLAGITAYIAGRYGMQVNFISLWKPEQWKGVVPKAATQAKFIRLYGKSAEHIVRNYSHDVIDAIMICEFWLTLYHRNKFNWQQQQLTKG